LASLSTPANRSTNRLISLLTAEEFERLQPDFEEVELTFNSLVYQAETPLEYVYFPLSGVLSMLARIGDNTKIEVGMVGCEGVAGLPIFLGAESTTNEMVVQAAGTAIRIKADAAVAEFRRAGRFHDQILLATHLAFVELSQTISCNRHHQVPERLARWLLMMHDRVAADSLRLTQDFLSWMLGVRNQTISLAAIDLQNAGLIRYARGTMTILDRPNLEKASCSCYQTIKALGNLA
jgi:CRP-like cAMP-binding protein